MSTNNSLLLQLSAIIQNVCNLKVHVASQNKIIASLTSRIQELELENKSLKKDLEDTRIQLRIQQEDPIRSTPMVRVHPNGKVCIPKTDNLDLYMKLTKEVMEEEQVLTLHNNLEQALSTIDRLYGSGTCRNVNYSKIPNLSKLPKDAQDAWAKEYKEKVAKSIQKNLKSIELTQEGGTRGTLNPTKEQHNTTVTCSFLPLEEQES